MHTGCPVIRGIKWGAPVWIHINHYEPEDYARSVKQRPAAPAEPGLCLDSDERCPQWAQQGECERNPKFMVGEGGENGACRQSCKACERCGEADYACIQRNRRLGGYLELDRAEMEWLGVPWWMGNAEGTSA